MVADYLNPKLIFSLGTFRLVWDGEFHPCSNQVTSSATSYYSNLSSHSSLAKMSYLSEISCSRNKTRLCIFLQSVVFFDQWMHACAYIYMVEKHSMDAILPYKFYKLMHSIMNTFGTRFCLYIKYYRNRQKRVYTMFFFKSSIDNCQ